MERSGEEGKQNQDERKGNENRKGKSCKGYLYYSSTLKSHNRNPRCIGIPRSLPLPRGSVVERSEDEASKKEPALVDFYYACVGYSVYMSRSEGSIDKEGAKTEFPACLFGLQLLVDRRPSTAGTASAPAHVHSREDRDIRQPRTQKPTHSVGDDFLNRFIRNANLVASGVAKNMRRVGNHIKETLDDTLFPYRRRPK